MYNNISDMSKFDTQSNCRLEFLSTVNVKFVSFLLFFNIFFRLFKTDFFIRDPVLVSLTFKLYPIDCMEVALQLHTNTKPTYLLLCPANSHDQGIMKLCYLSSVARLYNFEELRQQWHVKSLKTNHNP